MFAQFKSLPQLFDYFKDEETCLKYWEKIRWNGNITCPHCGAGKPYHTNRGYKCTNVECQKKFSALVYSIFENTKIPLRTWFAAIYLCTAHKKGISSLQLSRDLNIHQKSAWFVLQRIRESLKDIAPDVLCGTIEGDETYVGGKNKNRHKDKKIAGSQGRSSADKTPVVGLVERGGKVKTFVVANTDAETLHCLIDKNVCKESIIVTDAYRSYNGLEVKFKHVVVKHEAGGFYVVKEGDNNFHTQNIENFWSMLKRGYVGVYHYMSPKHLQRYCEEYSYRYNSRKISDPERFEDAINKCVGKRLTYNFLIADE